MKHFIETIQIVDPRQQHKVKHTLHDVIGLALIATLAGVDTLVDMEFFGEVHAETLAEYLSFPNGMPSHDTIGRVLQLVDPTVFYELQTKFNQLFIQTKDPTIKKIINIDGKTMRGNASKHQKASHIVSAWSKEDGVCFGQVTVDDKSNEITAYPTLLDTLHLEKMIVTTDAMGTQTNIVSKIVQKKADYVLTIKENQKLLYQDIVDYFHHTPFLQRIKKDGKGYIQTIEKSHSQIEKRHYYQTDDISWLETKERWKNLKSIGMVEKIIETDDTISVERRYYISSLQTDGSLFANAVRGHWDIEIMHWYLDVIFKEDSHKVLNKNAAINLNVLRKIALAIMKKWTPNTRKKTTSFRQKRVLLSMALQKFLPTILKM
ncbi:ISAs1 family transposase [Bacillus mycoides]|uniref:ISAs1 family transposase n=1 Tax=Bacillus mycoides TaxID=1405 RepID=UPI00273CDDBF|nr:ISAs1 family transposase [Bacillus mycoides]